MSNRRGPPKHQNAYAWKPNAGVKINETEVGGRFRPYSEITGVCARCREQIEWKRRYGKYKPLVEPAKCQKCSRRAVRQAYHNLCSGCAKEQKVCAKCRCRVDSLVGRDSSEVEAKQKALEEAIKNARERDRRTLLRAMNKSKGNNSRKSATEKANKAGDIFPSSSLEGYARSRQEGKAGCGNEEEVEGKKKKKKRKKRGDGHPQEGQLKKKGREERGAGGPQVSKSKRRRGNGDEDQFLQGSFIRLQQRRQSLLCFSKPQSVQHRDWHRIFD